LSHNRRKFIEEPKFFKLVKENVDTTTTTTACSTVNGAQQTSSNLKLKGIIAIFLVINLEENQMLKEMVLLEIFDTVNL
jgi:hypothetical protein